MRPFHLAFPVHDLEQARAFYAGTLACPTGREADHWIDFNLFGHQIVAHFDPKRKAAVDAENAVDGDHVPVPHFGVLLTPADWRALRDRLLADKMINWVIRPRIRFEGQPGEQATMFLTDPSGNALEFKSFADDAQIFAK